MSSYASIWCDVSDFLAENYGIALDAVAPETTLEDLGVDSLGMFSVVTLLENKHAVRLDSATLTKLRTVGDLVAVVRAHSSDVK
jgi:acyl carrier protein